MADDDRRGEGNEPGTTPERLDDERLNQIRGGSGADAPSEADTEVVRNQEQSRVSVVNEPEP